LQQKSQNPSTFRLLFTVATAKSSFFTKYAEKIQAAQKQMFKCHSQLQYCVNQHVSVVTSVPKTIPLKNVAHALQSSLRVILSKHEQTSRAKVHPHPSQNVKVCKCQSPSKTHLKKKKWQTKIIDHFKLYTPEDFNIEPENAVLEDDFPFPVV